MAEKTEQATPKKLKDARKKGQVAKSQDFPSAFTFIVSIAATMATAGYLFSELAGYFIYIYKSVATDPDLQHSAGGFLMQALTTILNCSLPIVIITSLVGILVNFIIVGPLFAPEAVKPDLKKLNPVTNLKNMFKFKTLFELLKSIFKITGAVYLIYGVLINSLPEIINTASISVVGSALVFNSFLFKVIVRVGIFFIIVAVIDLVFQKKNFAKEMKMEKFEVKQEYKDTEGDPHIKNRRKQVAQEIAYQEGPSAVKKARAIITNPVHLAVAIQYDEEKEPAPKIVTMGKGAVADLMIKYALDFHIPIMRNVPLAHVLYEKGKISDYIPEETYQAVAEILKWIASLEEGEYNVELFK
jgi:type III secretion protein U